MLAKHQTPQMLKAALAFSLVVVLGGCATYHIGNATLYPQEIKTVRVPIFESVSYRHGLGERLTEAVQKQIENKTNYKVVSDPNADSVLSGRIEAESKQVLVNSRTNDPNQVQTNLVVNVKWVDPRGVVLRSTPPISISADIASVQGSGSFVPQAGQSLSTAQQEAIDRLAEQIVGLMETPW